MHEPNQIILTVWIEPNWTDHEQPYYEVGRLTRNGTAREQSAIHSIEGIRSKTAKENNKKKRGNKRRSILEHQVRSHPHRHPRPLDRLVPRGPSQVHQASKVGPVWQPRPCTTQQINCGLTFSSWLIIPTQLKSTKTIFQIKKWKYLKFWLIILIPILIFLN